MRVLLTCAVGLALVRTLSAGETIKGEYLEARNSDVWAGECFTNSQIGIVGNKAILAWKVTEGVHQDVRLDGLAVVAVVISNRTFGIGEEIQTRTLFITDERANQTEREALIAMAKQLSGDTIQKTIGVRESKIEMTTTCGDEPGFARLDAGIAKIQTRCLSENDSTCSQERIAFPALSNVSGEYAAYSLVNEFSGDGFGETFSEANSKSALIANFSLFVPKDSGGR